MNANKHLPGFGILFLGVAYYIHTNYQFLVADQFEQVPLIYRALDPFYLINDWYVNANSGLSVRFFYTHVVAGIAQYISLSETMYILFALSMLATIFLVYCIATEISGHLVAGILSALTVLFLPDITLGGSAGIVPYLIPQTIAIPFVLLGFYLFLKERYLLSFTALGFATYFQMLWGLQAAAILTIILGYITLKTKEVKTLVPCLAYPLVSLPALFVLVTGAGGNTPIIINTILFRMPHHYLPSTWAMGLWLKFIGFALVVLIATTLARKRNPTVISILVLVTVFCCIGIVFVELVAIPTIIKFQLFKSTFFFVMFGTIIIINTLFQYIPELPVLPFLSAVPILIICILLGSVLISTTTISASPSLDEQIYQRVTTYTRPDDTFLVPPKMEGFRTLANRSVVVDWKGLPLKDESLVEYNMRMNDITGHEFTRPLTIEQANDYYENLSVQQITDLKKKYNATYAIQGGTLL